MPAVKGISTLLFTVFFIGVFAQEKIPIKILNADLLKFDQMDSLKVKKLIGNVRLAQDSVILSCDSAFVISETNSLYAFGHVHIDNQDSLDIYSDSLKYFGDEKMAYLYRNVKLIQNKTSLFTDELRYDTRQKVAHYYNGAKIINGKTTLTSQRGTYYETSQVSYFKDDVVLVNPSYSLKADTLKYNAATDITYFLGPTDIVTDSNNIYCERGWFDSKREIGFFKKNATMKEGTQIVKADSIYFDQSLNKGNLYDNITWTDTTEDIQITCHYAEFSKDSNTILATLNPVLTTISDSDSMHIAADTLFSYMIERKEKTITQDSVMLDSTLVLNDTTAIESNPTADSTKSDKSLTRVLQAYHNVKIFKEDLRGLCDSLSYLESDSMFTMYYDPVLWVEESQLTADTIHILMKNQKIDKLEMIDHGFILSKSDSLLYDQIKGRDIHGFFKNDKLHRMHVVGNGESIYYAKDDTSAYLGANQAQCSEMMIFFADDKVHRINFMDKPDATFHPIQHIIPEELRLLDFKNRIAERPKSKDDLFIYQAPTITLEQP